MSSWNVVETKAKLSEILKKASTEPQIIESRGQPVAVILSIAEYAALRAKASGEALTPPAETPMMRLLGLSQTLREQGATSDLELPDRQDRDSNPVVGGK